MYVDINMLTKERDVWRKLMSAAKVGAIAAKRIALAFMLGTAWHAIAQDAKAPYPSMGVLTNT